MSFNEIDRRRFENSLSQISYFQSGGSLERRTENLSRKYPYSSNRLPIAMPTGELQSSVTAFMREIGLRFGDDDRKYFVNVENMPIDFIFVRASDIPKVVNSGVEGSPLMGITGSDIIWEKSGETGIKKGEGEEIPIFTLIPNARPSSLYVGVTREFSDRINRRNGKTVDIPDLEKCRIVTKFPNVTRNYLSAKGITLFQTDTLKGAMIKEVSGTDEAFQYIYGYEAILGVISSGKTVKANDIQVLEQFYNVTVKMIEYKADRVFDKGMTTKDMEIRDDLKELTYLALQKRGLV